jgi:hypothetical protein
LIVPLDSAPPLYYSKFSTWVAIKFGLLGVLAMQYPEIATAAISGPEAVGDTMKYTFERAIEIRGASAFFVRPGFQASCL